MAQYGVAVDSLIHDDDFDECDALLEDRIGDGWNVFYCAEDVDVRRRAVDGSSLTEIRATCKVPCPAQLFFEMLTCLEYRKQLDGFTTEISLLPAEPSTGTTEALYWRIKVPLLVDRDYVFLRRITLDKVTTTYRLVSLAAPTTSTAAWAP